MSNHFRPWLVISCRPLAPQPSPTLPASTCSSCYMFTETTSQHQLHYLIHLCFLLFNSSMQQIFWHCPFLPSWRLAGHNRGWIKTDTIDRFYQSCWLPIVSIHLLKMFHFLPIVSIIGSKKIILSIESIHRLKVFFSSKDHRSNQCFLQLIDYRYR